MKPHVKAAADKRRGTGFTGEILKELQAREGGLTVAEAYRIWPEKSQKIVSTLFSRILRSGRATRVKRRYFFVAIEVKQTPQVFRSLATLEAMQQNARQLYARRAQVCEGCDYQERFSSSLDALLGEEWLSNRP